jgi:hypothetical protein
MHTCRTALTRPCFAPLPLSPHRTGYAEVRRGRRLVISFIMTAVNYEYCFYWYLYQVRHTTGQKASKPVHGLLDSFGSASHRLLLLICQRLILSGSNSAKKYLRQLAGHHQHKAEHTCQLQAHAH